MLQEILQRVFGSKIQRSNMLDNWYDKELKGWHECELDNLIRTCQFFEDEMPMLSATVKQRAYKIKLERFDYARSMNGIKPKRSKGAKQELKDSRELNVC